MDRLRRLPSSVWHLLLVTLLGVPLISPLLHWTAVACTHDGHLHVHRIAAMRYAWENGLFFSRWLPDLAFGYGYPFFIYREPAPLYAALLPHLAGIPLPAASNLFYALCILAAGWFMYLWVRDVLGPHAGILAAAAYMAAPYVLLDTLVRGNAPESLALPLFPFLLWMGRRWLLRGTAVAFLLTTFGLALLSLSHNISTLIFIPTLLVYLLVVAWLHGLAWRISLGRISLAVLLGLGMTFFYTAGALLEMDQVTLQQSTTTRNNDFHFNFASLSEIVAPVTPEDPNLLNPPLPIRLGWVPVSLAILGITSLLWRRELRGERSMQGVKSKVELQLWEQKGHIVLMAVAAAVYLFMALPISLPLWENIPLIDFVQFPWRFIGRAALPIAFLAAAPFACTPRPKFRNPRSAFRILYYVALFFLILEAIPALYPRYCDEQLFPSILTVHNYERATGLVGVDPEGSYFPRTVEKRPDGSPLEADYQSGGTPQRFDLTVLPEDATAVPVYNNLAATITLDSPEPFTARYLSFAFPGWIASVDGEQVAITPGDPDGLITFPVAAGSHTITVRWALTPLRIGLTFLSLAALVMVLFVTWRLWRRPETVPNDSTSSVLDISSCCPLSPNDLLVLLLLGIMLIGVKVMLDHIETPLRRTTPPPVVQSETLQAAELRFDGFNLSSDQVAAGETFDIDLAWTAVAPATREYQSNIWLADPAGLLWSDKETQRPRIYEDAPPTWEWQPDQWAWDSREIAVLPGTPAGIYDIVLTQFDLETLQPLTLMDAQGVSLGPTTTIGQITVTWPSDHVDVTPQYSLDLALPESGLRLLGFNQDRAAAVPGEELLLTLFWERLGADFSENITVHLLDANDATKQTWTWPLVTSSIDISDWPQEQPLRSQHLLRLPATLDSGSYQFVLADDILLGELTIDAPDRVFEAPVVATVVSIPFGDQIEFSGYTLQQQDFAVQLDLVWQALSEIPTSYRVFVHVVDENGQILAQSDGEPANWTRPTTGWASGEYIVDSHQILLPNTLSNRGLEIYIGLYDPQTGQRLSTGQADFVILDNQQQ
ncbi:MAG: hypothetical protein KDE48_19370 [Anaerolineales bacterium]|nr:hypothetical protein [Anaerolineales bacterium]